MAITIYHKAKGRQYTFQMFEKDGKTPRNLTGLTVTWRWKALDDATVLLSAHGNQTDPPNGIFYVIMDDTLSGTVRSYITQFEIVDAGGTLLDPSEFIVVNVVESAAVAG